MSRRDTARRVRDRLDAGFRYAGDLDDKGLVEHWASHADAVRKAGPWRDDCDGYALTAAQLLVEDENVPTRDVLLAYCHTETGGGHLVCFVQDSVEGQTWVIDNRQREVWSWRDLRGYEWKSALAIGEKAWRQINQPT